MENVQEAKGLKPQSACRRCEFVADFMKSQGLTYMSAGKILGTTHSSVFHALCVADDMRISAIFALFESQGFNVRMQLVRPGDEELTEIVDSKNYIIGSGGTLKLRRLSFISLAVDRYSVGVYNLCKSMNPPIEYSTFRRWRELDDCFISRVYSIAETLGLDFIITISPVETPQVEPGKPKCVVKFVNEKVQTIG